MLRVLGVACAVVAFCAPAVSTRADDANAECTNNNDVTIVIDFNELGGGVNVRCAPQPVNSGFDAFRRTNIAVDDYRGFVCRIAGVPEEGPCDRYPPSNYYWVYWLAPRGGSWCYSQVGAGNRTPPPGSIEGWSFFKKTSAKPNSTPPRYPVPGVIAGTTPNQLGGGDCATSTKPTTTTTAAPSGPAPTSPASSPGATVRNGVTATTARGTRQTTTVPTAPGATTTSTALELGVPSASASTTTSSIPLGNVDLTIRRHASKGSPAGFIVGAGIISAFGATAYVLRRRR
ncbi:MAG: hypothetical protein Q8K63_02965 [Acidimicrobiales bacterium]|nr:hypothetical protein [Acidimicrobiales bacterium]